jgi:hypothetical protein
MVIEFGDIYAASAALADIQSPTASDRLALGFGQLTRGIHVWSPPVGSRWRKRHLPHKIAMRSKGGCQRGLHCVDFVTNYRSIVQDVTGTRPGNTIEYGNMHAPSAALTDIEIKSASDRLALGFGQLIEGVHAWSSPRWFTAA